jgi:hypothetical protein
MKLIYADDPDVDEFTFKRLMLLGNELTFVERPSILLAENFGTGGVIPNVASLEPQFDGSAISLRIGRPPSTVFASAFYNKYFEIDLRNPTFVKLVLDALATNQTSHWYFDSSETLAEGEYADMVAWVTSRRHLLDTFDFNTVTRPENIGRITSDHEARFAVRTLLAEASMRITAVMSVAQEFGGTPICAKPYLNQLLVTRLSDAAYTGTPIRSRHLGLRLFESLVPDEALLHLTITDLLLFRERTKPFYEAWSIEVAKLEADFSDATVDMTDKAILNIIDSRITPSIVEVKNEIRKIRDEVLASAMKLVTNLGVSVVAAGYLYEANPTMAIGAFITSHLKSGAATDNLIDAAFKIRNVKRSSGLTYLMKVNQLIKD